MNFDSTVAVAALLAASLLSIGCNSDSPGAGSPDGGLPDGGGPDGHKNLLEVQVPGLADRHGLGGQHVVFTLRLFFFRHGHIVADGLTTVRPVFDGVGSGGAGGPIGEVTHITGSIPGAGVSRR